MKVKITFRALCPYKIDEDGNEYFNRYSKEYEAKEIKIYKDVSITVITGERTAEAFLPEQLLETVYITE